MIRLEVKSGAASLLLALLLVWIAAYALRNPLYTWDLVPYVATAIDSAALDATALHEATYSHLRRALPAPAYDALVAGPYGERMAADAGDFASQLPMYRVKPGYIVLLRLMTATGVPPVDAVMLLSLLPGLLVVLLLFVWARHYLGPWAALAAVGLFVPAARLVDISRVPVPDNLSTLVVLLAVYGLTRHGWRVRSYALLLFAIAVRVNNVVFVGLLLVLLAYTELARNRFRIDASLLPVGGALLLSGGLYLVITWLHGHQWWRLFYHTFVASIRDLDSFSVPFSLPLYLDVVRSALGQFLASGGAVQTVLPVFLLSGLLLVPQPAARRSVLAAYLLLFLPTLLVYLLLFPLVSSWDRFFTPFYALLMILACEVAGRRQAPADGNSSAASRT